MFDPLGVLRVLSYYIPTPCRFPSSKRPFYPTQVLDVIHSTRPAIEGVEDRFVDWMIQRYGAWVAATERGLLTCGMMVLKKKQASVSRERT